MKLQPSPAAYPEKLLRLPAVLAMRGRSRSAHYADIEAGLFPKPIKIGARAVAWKESEVLAWIEARAAERDGAAA